MPIGRLRSNCQLLNAESSFCFKGRMELSRSIAGHRSTFRTLLALAVGAMILIACSGCDVQRRKSDAELGLNPQQAAGRRLYDQYCDRCHEPYSSRDKKGRSRSE